MYGRQSQWTIELWTLEGQKIPKDLSPPEGQKDASDLSDDGLLLFHKK